MDATHQRMIEAANRARKSYGTLCDFYKAVDRARSRRAEPQESPLIAAIRYARRASTTRNENVLFL